MTEMWARIENGTVAEITEIDPVGRFHPSLHWEPCGPEVLTGWVHNSHGFAAPVNMPTQLSFVEVESVRLRAYADPVTGSDRYFAEAQRESLLGNVGAAEAAKVLGLARFAEIQAANPWPGE